MKTQFNLIVLLLLVSNITVAQQTTTDFSKLKGPYLGQTPPGLIPELFAPGIISTGLAEFTPAFSPDGKDCFYTLIDTIEGRLCILYLKRVNNIWQKPVLAPFSVDHFDDADLTITPDGTKVYFWSSRSVIVGEEKKDGDLWFAEKLNDKWQTAERLDTLINNKAFQNGPCVASNGNLYFASRYKNNFGRMDIYKSELINRKYSEPINLGDSINSNVSDEEPFIAPDESYIIFNSNRDGSLGKMDLYISFRGKDGRWTKAVNMGNTVNSTEWEGVPIVTPDGKYFFFSSTRKKEFESSDTNAINSLMNGKSNVYWMDAKIIEELKLKNE